MAYSKSFLVLGLVLAVFLVISSEVAARELSEERHVEGYGYGHGGGGHGGYGHGGGGGYGHGGGGGYGHGGGGGYGHGGHGGHGHCYHPPCHSDVVETTKN